MEEDLNGCLVRSWKQLRILGWELRVEHCCKTRADPHTLHRYEWIIYCRIGMRRAVYSENGGAVVVWVWVKSQSRGSDDGIDLQRGITPNWSAHTSRFSRSLIQIEWSAVLSSFPHTLQRQMRFYISVIHSTPTKLFI